MLTLIQDSIRHGVHQLRTQLYERSNTWRRHPLNPRNMPRDVTASDYALVDDQLRAWTAAAEVPVQNFRIDIAAYNEFKQRMKLPPVYAVGNRETKFLLNFLAYKLLDLDTSDVFLDVTSEESPFPALYRKRFGMDVRSRVLPQTSGVNGRFLSGDAAEIALPDESVTKVCLQGVFEHFEGKLDGRFLREVRRVLQPGGKCLILPLQLAERHLNIIDPLSVKSVDFPIDPGAITVAEPSLVGRFERVYSPASLSRILVRNMRYSFFRIVGRERIESDPRSSLHRIRYALIVSKI
jgi:SAM-dependent methyltransferase